MTAFNLDDLLKTPSPGQSPRGEGSHTWILGHVPSGPPTSSLTLARLPSSSSPDSSFRGLGRGPGGFSFSVHLHTLLGGSIPAIREDCLLLTRPHGLVSPELGQASSLPVCSPHASQRPEESPPHPLSTGPPPPPAFHPSESPQHSAAAQPRRLHGLCPPLSPHSEGPVHP